MEILIGLGLSLLSSFSCGAEPASPVVVELFTSQGCSDCPAADALISSWGREEFKRGRVLPLSFNIDYWNYLGWRDIFSLPSYSTRQRQYAAALGGGVYTPEMVVAGQSAFVGFDGQKASAEAARFLRPPKAEIEIATLPGTKTQLNISVKPLGKLSNKPHVMLALFENDLITEVSGGENAGRNLRNDFVVRRLMDLGPLSPDGFKQAVDAPWDPSWIKSRSGAAVFIQDADTMIISAARSLFPLAAD